MSEQDALEMFTTGGHTVFHVQTGCVSRGGGRSIISAAYDGAVLCHTQAGERLWENSESTSFPFDICVADLNGDGLDETLVAYSDGTLLALDRKGQALWCRQVQKRPLYQVAVARRESGACVILAGGVEDDLHFLSVDGTPCGRMALAGHITRVRAVDFTGIGEDRVVVATSTAALAGQLALYLIDPFTQSIVWHRTELGSFAQNSGRRFFSLAFADVDADGKKEILLSGSWGENGKIFAFRSSGEDLFVASDPRIPDMPYRMNILVPVQMKTDAYILGQFADMLIVYELDGRCREVVKGPFAYTHACFDEETGCLYCGSALSGGDEIVVIRLDRQGWQEAFANAKPIGKLARIIENLTTLRDQVAAYRAPAYQPDPRPVDVLLLDEYHVRTSEEMRPERQGKHVRYIPHLVLCQKPEEGALWCRARSAFGQYDLTANEVVAAARSWEEGGFDFVLQIGHTTAMHMSLETFKRVIDAAPRHLWGFDIAEIGEKLNADEQEILENILLPLLDYCYEHGKKKVLLRTKNVFWNGSVHLPQWRRVFSNPRYRDILIPCLEETNSRTQELSLAGRIGLWQSGMVSHWGARVETDNGCFNRSWEWSSQQVFSHHLRNLVSVASHGADVLFLSIHQGPYSAELEKQLLPFFEMLEKGIVQVPERSSLASLSPVALGMQTPSEHFIRHGTNGTRVLHPEDPPALIFDRLDWYWGGAPIAAHDVSGLLYGTQRRMCNFLPELPYGMVPIAPDTEEGRCAFTSVISTDGQVFYTEAGEAVAPDDFLPGLKDVVRRSREQLPVYVRGDAHWSAMWLDACRLRVIVIDPGYMDPADRNVELVLQSDGWLCCTDILSGESLAICEGVVAIQIPVGTLRIVDVTKQETGMLNSTSTR
jgi:lambda-carrageenase